MKRVEIIGNRSIEEDMFDFFERKKTGMHFTLFTEAQGNGTSNPKKGDAIWPEENFVLVVYCDDFEMMEIEKIIRELKSIFPDEGIKMFAAEAQEIV